MIQSTWLCSFVVNFERRLLVLEDHISSFMSLSFPFQNNDKNPDPLYKMDQNSRKLPDPPYKMDLDFWDCFGREKISHIAD